MLRSIRLEQTLLEEAIKVHPNVGQIVARWNLEGLSITKPILFSRPTTVVMTAHFILIFGQWNVEVVSLTTSPNFQESHMEIILRLASCYKLIWDFDQWNLGIVPLIKHQPIYLQEFHMDMIFKTECSTI